MLTSVSTLSILAFVVFSAPAVKSPHMEVYILVVNVGETGRVGGRRDLITTKGDWIREE